MGSINMFSKVSVWLQTLTDDEHAASIVEYALLLALIVLAAWGAVSLLGSNTSDTLCDSANQIFGAGC